MVTVHQIQLFIPFNNNKASPQIFLYKVHTFRDHNHHDKWKMPKELFCRTKRLFSQQPVYIITDPRMVRFASDWTHARTSGATFGPVKVSCREILWVLLFC